MKKVKDAVESIQIKNDEVDNPSYISDVPKPDYIEVAKYITNKDGKSTRKLYYIEASRIFRK